MKYKNLTQEQKEWIAEMQRASARNRTQFTYVPSVICDTETGEVCRIRKESRLVVEGREW